MPKTKDTGRQGEKLVADMFIQQGWKVIITNSSNNFRHGVAIRENNDFFTLADIIAIKEKEYYLIQVKTRRSIKVGDKYKSVSFPYKEFERLYQGWAEGREFPVLFATVKIFVGKPKDTEVKLINVNNKQYVSIN